MTIHYPVVKVLLATFNGKKFLDAQIDSINNQEKVKTKLYVLDDGSSDGTKELLDFHLKIGNIHKLSTSTNLGASAAFKKLLKDSGSGDFYAFADQDDVWHPLKIVSQIQLITSASPTLVFSDRAYIDEDGVPIKKGEKGNLIPDFNNALVENICYGNTQLLNSSLRDLVLSVDATPKFFDLWIYLIASAFGEVKRVDSQLVDYRIHNHNTIGLGKKNLTHYKNLVIDSRDQCILFSQNFKSLDQEKQNYIEIYMKIFSSKWLAQRFYYSYKSKIFRQSKFQTILWKLVAPLFGSKTHVKALD